MKDIQLILNKPCSEQWNDMQQVSAGRHCANCEKKVYDLTTYSDAELLAFFKTKKENVCARLHASQLNRTLNVPAPAAKWGWLMPLAITAVALTPAKSQNLKPVIQNVDSSSSRSAVNNLQPGVTVSQKVMSGTVIDAESGRPLSGVKIRQSDFQNVLAITDHSGKFELHSDKVNMTVPCSFELNGGSVTTAYLKDKMIIKLSSPQDLSLGEITILPPSKKAMYIVKSGKKKCTIDQVKFNSIPSNWIENTDRLEGKAAKAAYGSKAPNGVVIISIKKEFAGKFDFSKHK
jgi:hypothetical protein